MRRGWWLAAVVAGGGGVAQPCDLSRVRPYALIPGAVKAGTTALHAGLVEALGLGEGPPKEVYFFNDEARYALGTRAYAARLGCGDGVRLDGSPLYLAHPLALGRAAAAAPWAFWVVMVREPVDRAYSHFNMLARYGARLREGGAPFDFGAAVRDELACLRAAAAEDANAAGAFDACVATRVGGPLGGLEARGKLALFGALNGVLSQSLYAPQLRRALRSSPNVVAVSQRALFDDGARTLGAVVAALGLRAHRALPKALRSYESLAPGREAFAVRPNATYAGHRHRVDGALRADLDALFAGPNAALADVLADDVQAAIGFAADAAWLPERRRPNLEGGELR